MNGADSFSITDILQRVRRNLPTLAGLGIILVFTLVTIFGNSSGVGRITSARVWRSDAIKWGIVVVLVGLVVFWEHEPLRSIGLARPSWRDLLWGIVVAFVAVVASSVLGSVLAGLLGLTTTTGALSALQSLSLGHRIEVVVTAAITEEILYRGYPIERLEYLSGSTTLAAALPVVFFVGVHLPAWGLATGIGQLVETLFLTGLYVWRRNLFACIVMHLVIDGLGLVLFPLLT